MENASKALLITATILLGVMVLSLGSYLFNVFGGTSEFINKRLTESQISEFNVQFTKYEGQNSIRAHEIVSIANLAKQNNTKYYGKDMSDINNKPYYIQVTVTSDASYYKFEQKDSNVYQDFLQKYSLKLDNVTPYYFKCVRVNINDETKLVKSITFSLNN